MRDATRTRAAILAAAQTIFSEKPFGQASLKDICALAGVNVALVSRYFGSKEKLFEEALDISLDVSLMIPGNRETFGATLAKLFVSEPEKRINPLPMLVFASMQKNTRQTAIDLVNVRILQPLGRWIGGKDGEARAAQAMAIATGYFTYKILLPLAPFELCFTQPFS